MPTRDRFSLLLVQISATLFPETERQSTPLPHTFLKMPQRAKIEHKLKDAVWRQFNFNLVILIPGAEHERINASLVSGGGGNGFHPALVRSIVGEPMTNLRANHAEQVYLSQ